MHAPFRATNGSSVVPELTTEESASHFTKWEGSWSFLTGMKWVRLSSDGNAKPSSFPPRREH